MSKLVTIYGGSGFVGRYIARRMAREGWRVRVAVRRPNEALFVKGYGAVGQLEPVLCNIRDDASVAAAMLGADAVVNCVGSFDRFGKNNFDAMVEGAGRVARLATDQGISRFVHLSAIGADAQAPSLYGQGKAAGEAAVLAHYPTAVILRPSVIFGTEDKFFNKFASLAGMTPVLPMSGANAVLQPVYVDDVARAAVAAVLDAAALGVYELGGPQAASLRDLLTGMFGVIQRRRLILNLPSALMKVPALGLDIIEAATARLIRNKLITLDQIQMLTVDNVVAPGAKGFAELGITPVAMEAVLPDYLWRFRPSGQYASIKDSARNLKKV